MISARKNRIPKVPSAVCAVTVGRTEAVRLFPFVCLFALFAIYYMKGLFVLGDTFQAYSTFNYSYNNFLTAGEFPQWLPYDAYGSPAEAYLMTFLGPFQVVTVFLGALLNVSDVWALFYFSIFLEAFVFVSCAYLFAVELYEIEIAASAVATWVAFSIFWNTQIFWPHRIVLYLPLMLYFTLRFHRTGDIRQVLRTGLIGVISLIGSVAYLAPVYAFILCVFFVSLRVFDRKAAFVKLTMPDAGILAELLLFFVVTGLYLYLFSNAFNGAIVTATDRDPQTGIVTLDTFLNYAESALHKLPEFVLGSFVWHIEYFFYVGVGTTGLILFALHRLRSGVFWALGVTCTVLFLLCLGPDGLVAYAAYWFPGMNRFRHLSFLLPMVKCLLFFLAGFGLVHLLRKPDEQRSCFFFWLTLGGLCIIVLKHVLPLPPSPPGWFGFLPEIGFGIVLLAGLCSRYSFTRLRLSLGVLLALGVALELGCAQYAMLESTGTFTRLYGRYPGPGVDVCAAQNFPFQGSRFTPEKSFPRAQAFVTLALRQPVNNFALLQFVGADPCAPIFRVQYAMPGVFELLNKAAPGALTMSNLEVNPYRTMSAFHWARALEQPWFREACGCDDNKLVLESPLGQRLDLSSSVRHYSANRLEVTVDGGDHGGMLYYAGAFHPEWRALVDGQPAQVNLARVAFMTVAVPPGVHKVALAFYNPLHEWARRVLSVSSCIALAYLLAAGLREQRCRCRPD